MCPGTCTACAGSFAAAACLAGWPALDARCMPCWPPPYPVPYNECTLCRPLGYISPLLQQMLGPVIRAAPLGVKIPRADTGRGIHGRSPPAQRQSRWQQTWPALISLLSSPSSPRQGRPHLHQICVGRQARVGAAVRCFGPGGGKGDGWVNKEAPSGWGEGADGAYNLMLSISRMTRRFCLLNSSLSPCPMLSWYSCSVSLRMMISGEEHTRGGGGGVSAFARG